MWKTRTLLALPIPRRAPTPASEEMSAFLWDWSSTSCPQSATTPPKSWALSLPRPKKRKDSSKGWGSGTFAGLLFSNLVSLLLGAGLGVWIYRRWSHPKFLIFSPFCIDSLVIISNYFFLRACGMHQQIVDILPHVHVSTQLSCFYGKSNVHQNLRPLIKPIFRTTRTIEVVIWPPESLVIWLCRQNIRILKKKARSYFTRSRLPTPLS